jgi:cysteine synthase A
VLSAATIGQTPLTALPEFGEDLYGKLEFVHPTRSAKFRALAPHLYALASAGELDGIEKVVIRSAGSAAVTTAWLCRRLGIRIEAVLPKHLEEDMVSVLTRLGATARQLDPDQATGYIREMEGNPHAYVLDQFQDRRIVDHYRPLAGEILAERPEVSAIVVGIGTAACIMGIAHETRARQRRCRVIGVWPAEFDPTWSGPYRPHGISGLAPPVRQTHLDRTRIDDILMVPSADAMTRRREIFRRAGLPVGTSSGATLEAALRLRRDGMPGPIACIFASTFDCHLPEGL